MSDVVGSPLEPLFDLISEAQRVPGCDVAPGDFLDRLIKALQKGVCLGR